MLVRPDRHVAWRGNDIPSDAEEMKGILGIVLGWKVHKDHVERVVNEERTKRITAILPPGMEAVEGLENVEIKDVEIEDVEKSNGKMAVANGTSVNSTMVNRFEANGTPSKCAQTSSST